MSVELVRTQTSDGLRLDGALQLSTRSVNAQDTEAIILLSGVGSNFYGSTLINLVSDHLVESGYTTLRVNTRGHDGISTASTISGGRLQGAAYERVDDCRLDLAAWMQLLAERGFSRVALVGHSLGAIKAVYAAAYGHVSYLNRVIAVSPPRLSFSAFQQDERASLFMDSIAEATQLVEQGQPLALFEAKYPFPLVISAETYLDKYGPEERYNLCRFATRVRAPLDFVFGQRELEDGGSAFQGIVESLQSLDWPRAVPSFHVIDRADHFYAGRIAKLAELIVEIL